MNYRKTAEFLNVSQPAVTQHIQYLEKYYNSKLVHYDGKLLSLTQAGKQLEAYGRSAVYNEEKIVETIHRPLKMRLRIGATKTIGDYIINPYIVKLSQNENLEINVQVDNTENLLLLLEHNQLDFILVEGYFNKERYDYELFQAESFVGLCSLDHPFLGKTVAIKDLMKEPFIVREQGSGTRAVFEQMIGNWGYSIESFHTVICLSSFALIIDCVKNRSGITFAYESIAKNNPSIGTFTISEQKILHEFNFVYLKDSKAYELVSFFKSYKI